MLFLRLTLRRIIILLFSVPVVANAETSHMILESSADTLMQLTVYESNFAIVRDSRNVVLPVGTYELEFQGIARDIDPTSVMVSSSKTGLRVIEQNYRFDLLNKETLLERFLGRKLKYSRTVLQGTTYEKVLREGVLLSTNPEVVKFGDEIEIEPEGIISLPYFPEDLTTEPTLVWLLENKLSGPQNVTATYITSNVSWHTDYVANLSVDETELDISAWVTVNNNSGKTYENTELRLVSGQINRSEPQFDQARSFGVAKMAESSMPSSENFFEYHQYNIHGKTTLQNHELKQLKLMEVSRVNVDKTYVLQSEVYRHQMPEPVESKFDVVLNFTNVAEQPLPMGRFRVFAANSEGTPQLAGEDRIAHTPVDGKLSVKLGKAFDISAKRTQTVYKRVGDRGLEVGYRIDVKNHKTVPVTVELRERVQGAWRLMKESEKSKKVDSATRVYSLDLGKSEEVSLSYTVRMNW
jgi:hypothetical protein